jgi:NAD(P)-dependent dehydrogenase (short-subunit alcohol dehydrogenase family)
VYRKGAFLFSKATLPLLLKGVDVVSKYPPSLIFTGATASIKGSAQLSSFASGKFALRALSQSLAREFGPKGVHVSHAIIDGVIDIPRTKDWLKDAGPDAKLSADGVSCAFLSIIAWLTSSRLPMCIGPCIRNLVRHLSGNSISGRTLRNGRGEFDS